MDVENSRLSAAGETCAVSSHGGHILAFFAWAWRKQEGDFFKMGLDSNTSMTRKRVNLSRFAGSLACASCL